MSRWSDYLCGAGAIFGWGTSSDPSKDGENTTQLDEPSISPSALACEWRGQENAFGLLFFRIESANIVLATSEIGGDVVRKWPINELKRWAAAPEKEVLFLDFGEHPDGYVALSTNKSTEMAKKIKECINSIVEGLQQKKKKKEEEEEEEEEETTTPSVSTPSADAPQSTGEKEKLEAAFNLNKPDPIIPNSQKSNHPCIADT
eukprot:CAMPEP_0174240828 /NCGR_PEP_ID=MMETSP0417-20130205/20741_1 /TAXON_ID=242541 /ORGANISM="Mayorella sp, Strain BSH-02190019" /LENGTH=202 /DNA_ID=CAMNT_0015319989 /DNA_START=48 /DNA_END=651 /DNA_ORIENTATION=+